MPTPPHDAGAAPRRKADLRARFRAYRRSLTPEAYARQSHAAVAQLLARPEVTDAAVVHVYWPMTGLQELDTRPLIHALHAQKKQIVLPVVHNFARAADGPPRMRHVAYDGPALLQPNAWGIHEPSGDQTVPVEEIEVVIVPALGAGRNGHRVGHGYGYYDEFLSRVSVPRLCPVYAACLVDQVPAEPHDVPMTVLVTEREALYPRAV